MHEPHAMHRFLKVLTHRDSQTLPGPEQTFLRSQPQFIADNSLRPNGAGNGNRTHDLPITNRLLYR